MKASIVDLRYKSTEILQALERNEPVTVLYHGKPKGIIQPVNESSSVKVEDHPFFASVADHDISVEEELAQLRKGRHDF